MGMKVYSFRLDESLIRLVDGLGVKRSDFVRDCLWAGVWGFVGCDGVVGDAFPFGVDVDGAALVSALGSDEVSREDLQRRLGFGNSRYLEAERRVVSRGRVVLDGCMLRVVG